MIAQRFIELFVQYAVLFLGIGGMVACASGIWALAKWAWLDEEATP